MILYLVACLSFSETSLLERYLFDPRGTEAGSSKLTLEETCDMRVAEGSDSSGSEDLFCSYHRESLLAYHDSVGPTRDTREVLPAPLAPRRRNVGTTLARAVWV